jgi:hypothetical protein
VVQRVPYVLRLTTADYLPYAGRHMGTGSASTFFEVDCIRRTPISRSLLMSGHLGRFS